MNSKVMNKKIKNMFPEYRERMNTLKQENPHFARLLEDHDALDKQIIQLELDPVCQIHDDIESLKRKKLRLKDEMYQILRVNTE
ncbi:YdcH family protein [Acinetobacter gerneri]|jgi:uncharacterized protein YdcH (DUF465 family)|uniref:DUF465 domain-containing protein n=2 Tax=Acinetobacter gerneri TaxID=202952 RepID=N8ZJJ3_9GAMM|nr:YdcH family protein [Acinetobacter gerneri]ENV31670.1 hypothetical protein F960_04035 [Acinetobacter gerneri DSM 14967 = CIP 107464 = MTCC 9824]EPR83815.1 hypothetical protein L289_1935 [Acinetobacter gerneri DSM 14967 = CIP 107464 = MTCC 9824]MCH4244168.1 YdcH family protein [Acinetobacter gerneri]MDQ9008498.1 YdcH family protein [Acinetobacter gerneri]MDQ9012537.1 YdcH family protein [Acinetobacter gerneri]